MHRDRAEAWAGTAGWLALSVVAAAGWYATGRGLAARSGLEEAASGIGVIAALTVVVTLWRWRRRDGELDALLAGRCPRCEAPIAGRHDHGSSSRGGLDWWSCAACGFERGESLTCERCAA